MDNNAMTPGQLQGMPSSKGAVPPPPINRPPLAAPPPLGGAGSVTPPPIPRPPIQQGGLPNPPMPGGQPGALTPPPISRPPISTGGQQGGVVPPPNIPRPPIGGGQQTGGQPNIPKPPMPSGVAPKPPTGNPGGQQVTPPPTGNPGGQQVVQQPPVNTGGQQGGQQGTQGNPKSLKQGASYNPTGEDDVTSNAGKGKRNNQKNGNTASSGMNKNTLLIVVLIVLIMGVGFFVLYGRVEKPEEPDPSLNEPITPETVTVIPFSYTAEDKMLLRTAGYTADEIEEFEKQELDAATKAQEAIDAQEALQTEILNKCLDGMSDEYWAVQNGTWLGLPVRYDMADVGGDSWLSFIETRNVDYEKIDVHGTQCFIKVYLDDNEHELYCFMQVTPKRYSELNDAGNIVVEITFDAIASYDETTEDYTFDSSTMYINDIVEVMSTTN